MIGWRKRLGLIVPSSDGTCEAEFNSYLPEGVALHTSRILLEDGITDQDSLKEMNDGIERSAKLLSTVNVDLIAYACTTGSLIEGLGYETKIEQRISEIVDVPSVATAASVKRALDELDAQSVAISTPYISDLNQRETEFLTDSGYKVVDIDGLGLRTDNEIAAQTPQVAYQQTRSLNHADADCVFISCTGYPTADIIETLEADIGKPVITSNQATLWDALSKMKINYNDISLGTLFDY